MARIVPYKPHLAMSGGRWHCSKRNSIWLWWGPWSGDTPRAAYSQWYYDNVDWR